LIEDVVAMSGKTPMTDKAPRTRGRRKLLALSVVAVIMVLIVNPQFAFLSVLLDATVLDTLVLLCGLQWLLFRDQLGVFFVAGCPWCAERWRRFRRGEE
jgi:hypothetical protein